MRNKYLPVLLIASIIFVTSFCSALTITASVPGQYQTVSPGNPVYVHTEVKWPENNAKVDLVVEYNITNTSGNSVAYLKVLRAIETQTSFLDSIQVPSGTPSGEYTVSENISFPGSTAQEVASSFTVSSPDSTSNGMLMTYILVIAGIVMLIAVLAVIELAILLKKKR
jgi:hypothetical protein